MRVLIGCAGPLAAGFAAAAPPGSAGACPTAPRPLDGLVALRRAVLGNATFSWAGPALLDHSLSGGDLYGFPDLAVARALDLDMGAALTGTDFLAAVADEVAPAGAAVAYLEIGVSVGKNFYSVLQTFPALAHAVALSLPRPYPPFEEWLRSEVNSELNFPPNFEGLVLGCIDADFCK